MEFGVKFHQEEYQCHSTSSLTIHLKGKEINEEESFAISRSGQDRDSTAVFIGIKQESSCSKKEECVKSRICSRRNIFKQLTAAGRVPSSCGGSDKHPSGQLANAEVVLSTLVSLKLTRITKCGCCYKSSSLPQGKQMPVFIPIIYIYLLNNKYLTIKFDLVQ